MFAQMAQRKHIVKQHSFSSRGKLESTIIKAYLHKHKRYVYNLLLLFTLIYLFRQSANFQKKICAF